MWLLKNIEKRKLTILRITEAIMNAQKEFLDKGIRHLTPLTLKEIADEVEMHESTVARVTSSKYVETPRGTFSLKFFFSSGLETESGETRSSTSVKEIIAGIIENEPGNKPFSDQKIARMLGERGIKIARRTVAKYREQMRILPAKLRAVCNDSGEPLLAGDIILTKGLEGCLAVYPEAEWNAIQALMATLEFTDKAFRSFSRRFYSFAAPVKADKNGRILIPAHLIAEADLSGIQSLWAYLAYIVLAQSLLWIPLLLTLVVPDRAGRGLVAINAWTKKHEKRIEIIVAVLFGLVFLAIGLEHLGVF